MVGSEFSILGGGGKGYSVCLFLDRWFFLSTELLQS